MAIRADELIDRRRLRRKLTFWRIATLAIAALGRSSAISVWLAGDDFAGTAVDHIAKVKIEGTITEDDELIERLEKIRKSSSVKGVILSIDSPGGTTAGGEQIFEEIRMRRGRKAGGGPGRHARRIGRLHDRQRHRPYRRPQILDRRLDRRAGAVSRS